MFHLSSLHGSLKLKLLSKSNLFPHLHKIFWSCLRPFYLLLNCLYEPQLESVLTLHRTFIPIDFLIPEKISFFQSMAQVCDVHKYITCNKHTNLHCIFVLSFLILKAYTTITWTTTFLAPFADLYSHPHQPTKENPNEKPSSPCPTSLQALAQFLEYFCTSIAK